MYISIGQVSTLLGISISTLRRYDDNGIFTSSYRTPGGHRRYELSIVLEITGEIPSPVVSDTVIGYARVSGHKQKKDLQTQIHSIEHYAKKHNFRISKVYSDIASGINDSRRNFIKMLKSIPVHRPKALIITYQDRLSRYGINVIRLFCDLFNCRLVSIHADKGDKDYQTELVEGVIEVITSYAGRLHRQRRGTLVRRQFV